MRKRIETGTRSQKHTMKELGGTGRAISRRRPEPEPPHWTARQPDSRRRPDLPPVQQEAVILLFFLGGFFSALSLLCFFSALFALKSVPLCSALLRSSLLCSAPSLHFLCSALALPQKNKRITASCCADIDHQTPFFLCLKQA